MHCGGTVVHRGGSPMHLLVGVAHGSAFTLDAREYAFGRGVLPFTGCIYCHGHLPATPSSPLSARGFATGGVYCASVARETDGRNTKP
jgi:hypothetical protein